VAAAEDDARRLDAEDPGHRELFLVPPADGGAHPETAYLAGNSLGLQPRAVRRELLEDLDAWARLGVEGHLEAARPWLPYHELLRDPAARLVGALPAETVVMNSLTVNLHLLMVSFYRPAGARTLIVVEDSAFPSDSYAVRSQAAFHGLDPDRTVLRTSEPLATIREHGDRIALVLLGGVNYLTGELMDIPGITAAGRAAGAVVGWDLAHAAGNVPLRLHEWGVDFAAWCSYKYLNAGPGAVAAAFVHERHGRDASVPRLAGWWGNDPATRFQMRPEFVPTPGADGWQLSNPPILALAPLRVSLEVFHRAGLWRLREKSIVLTRYFETLIRERLSNVLEIATPREAERRGCQLSLRVRGGRESGRSLLDYLNEHGIIVDWREPDVIRASPTPLYNRRIDCLRFVLGVRAWASRHG